MKSAGSRGVVRAPRQLRLGAPLELLQVRAALQALGRAPPAQRLLAPSAERLERRPGYAFRTFKTLAFQERKLVRQRRLLGLNRFATR